MTQRLRPALLVAALLFSGSAVADDSGDQSPKKSRTRFAIAGLRAYLYYEGVGAMDERELFSGRFALWNALIGAGDARAPSGSTIVFVDLSGPAFLAGTTGSVRVVATAGGRVLRREAVSLSAFFSEGPRLSIPFIVVGTGCGTLRVDATLLVPGHEDRLRKEVPFNCGE